MTDLEHLPAVAILAAPIYLIAIAWEWWAVKSGRATGKYETKDALTSIAMGLGNATINTVTAMTFTAMMMWAWPYRLYEFPFTWWSVALCFVLYDFIYYWKHRLAHRCRWWWMEHVTHHSSQEYNLTTAVRQPWFGPFTGLALLGIPLMLIGFHPGVVGFVGGINLFYQFWIHTQVVHKFPKWVEAIFNTPSHHRVHHAINPRYLDRNFGGVFIVFDKWFGTFEEERDDEVCEYGLVKQRDTNNPIRVAYHGAWELFQDCKNDGFRPWRWFGRLINPPGWSPDGQHNRSIEIRAEWEKQTNRKTEHIDVAAE